MHNTCLTIGTEGPACLHCLPETVSTPFYASPPKSSRRCVPIGSSPWCYAGRAYDAHRQRDYYSTSTSDSVFESSIAAICTSPSRPEATARNATAPSRTYSTRNLEHRQTEVPTLPSRSSAVPLCLPSRERGVTVRRSLRQGTEGWQGETGAELTLASFASHHYLRYGSLEPPFSRRSNGSAFRC